MALKSREDLQRHREEAKGLLAARDAERVKIIVGMGTCGIAAGARDIMAAIVEELGKHDVKARVIQTGCIGMCVREPLVDVQFPGMERITYGNVKAEDVPRIIGDHVAAGKIVEDLVVARFVQI